MQVCYLLSFPVCDWTFGEITYAYLPLYTVFLADNNITASTRYWQWVFHL